MAASKSGNMAFDEPWRKTPWDKSNELKKNMKLFQPANPQVKHIRILLHGPVGAGKSSFINSINSIFQERMTNIALADAASAGYSFTIRYQTHKIENGNRKTFLPFVFNDIMGLEPERQKGAHQKDIILAMKGRVKEGHKFNPVAELEESDLGYNNSPTSEDKVHCLVCVIPTDKVSLLSDEIFTKMRHIREAASHLGIPQMAILTRVDEACPLVKKDLKNIYMSKYIKVKMEQFSGKLGIPVNCIFPVKNYHEEIDLDGDIDVLILRALKQMIDFGDDFIKTLPDKDEKFPDKDDCVKKVSDKFKDYVTV